MVIGGAMDLPSTSPIPKLKPFTNGGTAVKPGGTTPTTYRECLKNHAASIGGHALDGCGEFMPSPADPTSLKCAACSCHRNFHRRHHPDDHHPSFHPRHSPRFPLPLLSSRSRSRSRSHSRSSSPGPTPSPTPSPHSPPPVSHLPPNSFFSSPAPAHILLALSNPTPTPTPGPPTVLRRSSAENSSRKRFRTKFSQEQKSKMCAFAERLGWRMQRGEEKLIEGFCNEIGVRKGVLKVWMHNNKHTIGKIERSSPVGLANNNIPPSHNNLTLNNNININGGGDHHNTTDNNNNNDDDDDVDVDDDDADDDDDDDDADEDRKPSLNNGSSSSS